MNTKSNEEFAKKIMQIADTTEAFKPHAIYDHDGDCIEFFVDADDFYAQRIDDLVTVYYSQETNEIVGSLIKGVSEFCKEFLADYPGFIIEVEDNKVNLAHIFLAHLWRQKRENKFVVITYQKLIQKVQASNLEAELKVA